MEYVPIRVSTLRGDLKIDFNAFVKINDKYILYVRRGDSFEGTRLQRLKDKKLKKMFIIQEDETNYRSYLSSNLEMAYDKKSGKDLGTRSEIIQGTQQSNVEEVLENPESKENYDVAKQAAGQFVDFILNENQAVAAMMNQENSDQNVAHHGVTVSTLSIALAQKAGHTDPKVNQLLALGALLHDFGHHNSSLAINRPLEQMSKEELSLYKAHCENGVKAVQDKQHFDQVVLKIIMQHEEHVDGSGYPQGLRDTQMDPTSIFVSSANALDRLITFEKIPRDQAAKKLMMEQVGKHPLEHIKWLGEIINQNK